MKIKPNVRQFFAMAIAAICFAGSPIISQAQDQTSPTAGPADTAASIPSDVDPNSPLAQVIRLAQSGVDESVILAYITGSSAPFSLTPDQIIYLKDLGLPNDAVTAMIQRDQQLGAAAPAPVQPAPTQVAQPTAAPVVVTEPPAAVTQNYFYDTLSPYGGWVNVDGYGLCWQPTVVTYNTGWQPYGDHGHWVNTDSGWYWLSDYSWGSTAFHYGRWFRDSRRGWCWWPDTTWGPSWVTWRNTSANDYCGWAPLPPRTNYRAGVGIVFNGGVVAAGFDFGLAANAFCFVPTKNFCDPHPFRYRAPQTQITQIYQRTTIINNYNVNSRDKTIVNVGIAPERITAFTRQPIQRVTLRDSSTPVSRGAQLDKNTLIVNRPRISADTVTTLNKGVRPPVVRQNNPRPTVINNTTIINNNNNRNVPVRTPQNSQPNNFSKPNDNYSTQNRTAIQTQPTQRPVNNLPNRNPVTTTTERSVTQEKTVSDNRFAPGEPSRTTTTTTRKSGSTAPYNSPKQQDLQQQSRSVPYNRTSQTTSHTPANPSSNAPRSGNANAPSGSGDANKFQKPN